MNKQDKKNFIRGTFRALKKGIMDDIYKMPDDWDGVELGWLIIDKAKELGFGTGIAGRKAKFLNDRRELGI